MNTGLRSRCAALAVCGRPVVTLTCLMLLRPSCKPRLKTWRRGCPLFCQKRLKQPSQAQAGVERTDQGLKPGVVKVESHPLRPRENSRMLRACPAQ